LHKLTVLQTAKEKNGNQTGINIQSDLQPMQIAAYLNNIFFLAQKTPHLDGV